MYHTLKTIEGGFFGDGETNSVRRKYACQILTIEGSPTSSDMAELEAIEYEISFFEKNVADTHPHDDNPVVITVRCDNWKIKKVFIDQGCSTDILYWDAFKRLHLDLDDIIAFQ